MRRLCRRRRSMPFTPVRSAVASGCGFLRLPDAVRESCLLEMDFGAWEMRPWMAISDPRLKVWFADWMHAPTAGGESFDGMCGRVGSFIGRLKAAGLSRVLFFTHGGVIACARTVAGSVFCRTGVCGACPIRGRRHAAILTFFLRFSALFPADMARVLMYSGKRS